MVSIRDNALNAACEFSSTDHDNAISGSESSTSELEGTMESDVGQLDVRNEFVCYHGVLSCAKFSYKKYGCLVVKMKLRVRVIC